ncbi:hypothetical protein VPH35_056544 [Triticum aestivum]
MRCDAKASSPWNSHNIPAFSLAGLCSIPCPWGQCVDRGAWPGKPRPDSVRPTRQVLQAGMLSRMGILSTPFNASATTSRSGLLVMEKVLSRVLAHSTNMDVPCYPKILLVMFLRGHQMKNRRRVQPAKMMPGT